MNKIFIDLEMTYLSKKQRKLNPAYVNEIIEIGAVKLDEENTIVDAYKKYVCPEISTEITEYITRLTGITTEMVTGQPYIKDVIADFADWCGDDYMVYAWSDHDLVQVQKELEFKEIEAPEKVKWLMAHWADFQKEFGELVHIKRSIKLSDAIDLIGEDFFGKAHDALTDAYNTAMLYKMVMEEQSFARIKKILDEAFSEHHGFAMGEIFNFDLIEQKVNEK